MHGRHVGTLVIGAGRAGLTIGYHLRRRGLPFVIVDEFIGRLDAPVAL